MSVSSHKTEGNETSEEKADHQHSDADSLLRKKEFGSELVKARKALSLTAADVADRLLISEDIIKAIENSQAEDLPALTFTRGYIRSYARLVGVPAEKIISAYLSVAPDQNAPLSAHSVLPVQPSSSHFFIKIISAGLILFAVIFLFFKLYDTDITLQTADFTESDKPALRVMSTDELVTDEASSNKEISAGATGAAVTGKPGTEVPDTAKTTAADQASSLNQPTHSQSAQQSTPDVSKPDPAPQQNVPERAARTDAVVTLVLNAVDSSWVEVKDATQQRLYYQLLNAGEQISLKGQPPYSVFLGNARQVRVEINNQVVEFDHLIRNSRKTVNMKVEDNATVSLNARR